MFNITMALCERFPAYTPTILRKVPIKEYFLMVKRLNAYNEREKNKEQKKEKVIRRPAGDNWF